MSCENLQKPYKQRFKGVENFLRRVAYNLGNTASQTEVKIISCIPIDVTDLQQKIINLEKQLHESKQTPGVPGLGASEKGGFSDKLEVTERVSVVENIETGLKQATSDNEPSAVVNTAIFGSTFNRLSSSQLYSAKNQENMNTHQVATHCSNCSSRRKQSNVSYVFPALSAPKDGPINSFTSRENLNVNEEERNIFDPERYINIFKKRKRRRSSKGKEKIKTQLVYFAQQNQNNPFYLNHIQANQTLNKNMQASHTVSQIYLNKIMRRQYDPNFVIEDFSDTSQFSKPICRDIDQNCNYSSLYESDVCSCCHGKFQNIDNYMTNNFESFNRSVLNDNKNTYNTYYDSNMYDIIPVKDNSKMLLKENLTVKKDNTKRVDIRCWPEHLRSKYYYIPSIENNNTDKTEKKRQNKKVIEQLINNKEIDQSPRLQQQRFKVNKKYLCSENETSKSFSIDCGDIYTKHIPPVKLKEQECEPNKTILLKNELVETDDLNTKLSLQNQSTQLEIIPYENKTESTLNQIKSILQSVLTEVKTSTKVNNTGEIQKKDAVVQKGSSQNNMQGDSTFLHSFTYNNSYNANPYLPSCSQVPVSQYYYSGVPYHPIGKCFQNFPVFIHPATKKHTCAYCQRKSSHKSSNKPAATTGTNTEKEVKKASSKETEKLIKEIYKSMALNMNFPNKDNSVSEYDELKSAEKCSVLEADGKGRKENEGSTGIEILNKRDIDVEALISSDASNNCKLVYTTTNTQSEDNEKSYDHHYTTSTKSKADCDKILRKHEDYTSDTIIEDEEESESSNESENEIAIPVSNNLQPKKEKNNIFRRLLKSVKLFKKQKDTEKENDVEEESDDSDSDYETIYSRRSKKLPPSLAYGQYQQHTMPSNLKTKRMNQNQEFERARRSPYLEQEYRRQWNEKLMFDKHQERKYTSERPYSKQSSSKPRQPAYWNNYEARNAFVKHNFPIRQNCNPNVSINKNEISKSGTNLKHKDNNKEKLRWLKKHKLGIHCGEQWKNLILEN